VIAFVPAGAEKLAAAAPEDTGRRTVTFGTIPDFARESGGVRVAGLVPGSPAESVGIAVDDVIVEIDSTPIDNLYDYSAALKAHSPGDRIDVVVLRGGKRVTFTPTLVKRR
jgi:S1-C subfamily serine protease